MPVVGLETGVRYDAADLRRAVERAVAPLGGMARFVRRGQKVLVKPNVVAPARPETGICTHPLFVRAVCDLVAGCEPARIHVGEMSGFNFVGETRRCMEESGLAGALAGCPVRLVPFEGTHVRVAAGSRPSAGPLDVSREVLEADVVISLPKLKTHRLTGYTGAVKNAFGCAAPGTRERIHKVGNFREFCEGLVDVFESVRPGLTIADMIRVQEGNGPCAGRPVDVGAVLAAADGVALDAVGQVLLGIGPEPVMTTAIAHGRGLGEGDIGAVDVDGPPDWRLAGIAARRPGAFHHFVQFHAPKPLFRAAAGFFRVRPVLRGRDCEGCGVCAKACPAGALAFDGKRVRRDATACRLCFGCVAACPRRTAAARRDWISAGLRLLDFKFLR